MSQQATAKLKKVLAGRQAPKGKIYPQMRRKTGIFSRASIPLLATPANGYNVGTMVLPGRIDVRKLSVPGLRLPRKEAPTLVVACHLDTHIYTIQIANSRS